MKVSEKVVQFLLVAARVEINATSVENDLNREEENEIEYLGYEDMNEYGGTADSCDSMECREIVSSFEITEFRSHHMARNTYLRHPRRLVSKFMQKVKPSEVAKISSLSSQEEVSTSNSVCSTEMAPLKNVMIPADQSSDTSSTNDIDSMSAVYSQDQEKMFDREMCTKTEWVSIPDDVDSVAAKSALTANTDPMDIHDLTSWNFSLPHENFRPVATTRDCNYGN